MEITNNTIKLKKYLENFLVKRFDKSHGLNFWNNDVKNKLLNFSTSGKMIRGNLVLLASGRVDENALKVASAVELMHFALLTHDDIMDEDLLRRGKPSVYASYASELDPKTTNAKHYGISQAISLGDIAILLSLELLNDVGNKKIISHFIKEIILTAYGQMQDVYFGFRDRDPSEEEIIEVYRYKTARYSISTPIVLGMYLNKEKESLIKKVITVGECMGIIFQMKDDELGVFGNTENTGKGVFKDVNQNKKTLIRHLLLNEANTEEQRKLKNIFGNKNIDNKQINFLLKTLEKYEIKNKHQILGDQLLKEANIKISDLPKKYVEIFKFIQELNKKRNK